MEKVIDAHYDARSILLDVLVQEASSAVHDIELQNTFIKLDPLALRTCYIRSTVDQDFLNKGVKSTSLPYAAVILLFDFDPFGLGWYCYMCYTCCYGHDLIYQIPVRAVEIFLNIHDTIGHESPDLVAVFAYMTPGRV